MENFEFCKREPSIFKKAFFFIWGNSVWLAPLVVPLGVTGDWRWSLGAYGLLGLAMIPKVSRDRILKFDRWVRIPQRRFKGSVRISRVLRATLENAGLVEYHEYERTVDGKTRKEKETIFPSVVVGVDRFNYYLEFHMLPGQTGKQWEGKVDAFAQALAGDLIASEIRRGIVKVVVQHTEMRSDKVLYKHERGNFLNVGYTPKGILRWYFDEHPHMLIVGMTGSGKSTFLRNLFIQFDRDWIVDVIDGKYVEFSYLREYGFRVASCKEEFRDFVARAQAEVDWRAKEMEKNRVNHYEKMNYNPYFLVVDEFIFVAESLSAKKAKDQERSDREQLFEDLRDIALRGRACGVFLILILQRPDAAYLPTIIRDNLMAKVVLGQGSETAYEMAFGSERRKLTALTLGQGYAEIGEFTAFTFPNYEMEEFLEDLRFRRLEKLVDFPANRDGKGREEGEAL